MIDIIFIPTFTGEEIEAQRSYSTFLGPTQPGNERVGLNAGSLAPESTQYVLLLQQ
jgi:hypothetical protein